MSLDIKYDIVIPYSSGKNNTYSPRLKCGNRYEIEYVVQSIKKFCPWHGRIFLVGPKTIDIESIKDDVICIECDDPYSHVKDANIINKILTVINTVNDLSDNFVFASDDQVVTRKTTIEDFKPRVSRVFRYNTEISNRIQASKDQCTKKFWIGVQNTMKKFPKRMWLYEPHIWGVFNKEKFVSMCNRYDISKDTGVIIYSLYYNFVKANKVMVYDHKWFGTESQFKSFNLSKIPTHIGWNDGAYKSKIFRQFLNRILFGEKVSVDPITSKQVRPVNSQSRFCYR